MDTPSFLLSEASLISIILANYMAFEIKSTKCRKVGTICLPRRDQDTTTVPSVDLISQNWVCGTPCSSRSGGEVRDEVWYRYEAVSGVHTYNIHWFTWNTYNTFLELMNKCTSQSERSATHVVPVRESDRCCSRVTRRRTGVLWDAGKVCWFHFQCVGGCQYFICGHK